MQFEQLLIFTGCYIPFEGISQLTEELHRSTGRPKDEIALQFSNLVKCWLNNDPNTQFSKEPEHQFMSSSYRGIYYPGEG
jgi:hypothetical protein